MVSKDQGSFFFQNTLDKEKEELQKLEKKGAKKVLKWYDFGASKLRDEIKKHPAQYFFLFITTFLGSVITSSLAFLGFTGNLLTLFVPKATTPKASAVQELQITQQSVESNKYDPLLLASKLRKNETDFEVVDIRSESDFRKGHIVSAKNVPIYDTALITKSGGVNQEGVKEAFKEFLDSPKLLIVYAQSSYSTIPSDVAAILSNDAKKVKALAVGWEEWLQLQVR